MYATVEPVGVPRPDTGVSADSNPHADANGHADRRSLCRADRSTDACPLHGSHVAPDCAAESDPHAGAIRHTHDRGANRSHQHSCASTKAYSWTRVVFSSNAPAYHYPIRPPHFAAHAPTIPAAICSTVKAPYFRANWTAISSCDHGAFKQSHRPTFDIADSACTPDDALVLAAAAWRRLWRR